jgi:hypothetical protein
VSDTEDVFPDFIASGSGAGGGGGYELLLETVDVRVDTSWQYMMEVVTAWRPWMHREGGARLVCAGATITGQPGRLVHLWRVPEGFSVAKLQRDLHAHAATGEGRWVKAFVGRIERVSYDVLAPTFYDPARCWPDEPGGTCGDAPAPTAGGERPVRLIDVIDVKPGRLAALAKVKRDRFVPQAAELGVRLMASGTSATGLGRRLVQVWELSRADTLLDAMRRLSEVGWYQKMLRDNVLSERQDLLYPLAWYDPHPAYVADLTDPAKRCWRYGT